MPRRHQFYDPILQEPPAPDAPAPEIHLLIAPRPGTYLDATDVVGLLRRWATQNDGPYEEALTAAADAFAAVLAGAQSTVEPDALTEIDWPARPDEEMQAPVPEPPAVGNVYRVEVFPDEPDSPRPRWHARTVDHDGVILYTTAGSFDQDYVIRDARERWPEVDIQMIADVSVDSVWEEQATEHSARGVFSGRRRPSPRRMWGA